LYVTPLKRRKKKFRALYQPQNGWPTTLRASLVNEANSALSDHKSQITKPIDEVLNP